MKIYSSFLNSAKLLPSKTAVLDSDSSITYDELDITVNRIHSFLVEKGIKSGDVVGLYFESNISYVASLLAVNKAEAIFLPLEPKQPDNRIQQVIDYVRPSLIISDESLNERLQVLRNSFHNDYNPAIAIVNNDEILASPAFTAISGLENETLPVAKAGYILYTSGSTGKPKAIHGSEDGLDHFIKWEIAAFNLRNVNVSQLAPLSFDVSLRDILVPLYSGGTLFIPSDNVKQNIPTLVVWLSVNRINVIHMVPSVFRLLYEELGFQRHFIAKLFVKFIFLAGEALYQRDVSRWEALFQGRVKLINLYGPSETTLAKLYYEIPSTATDLPNAEIIPIGIPIYDTTVRVIKNGLGCSTGEIGEIFIGTEYRSNGYFKDEKLTADNFLVLEDGKTFYKTGDLGRFDKTGNLHFVGRLDNQIKINGNRIELAEIEAVLNEFSSFNQSVVHPFYDEAQIPELVCYYVADKQVSVPQLKEYLSAQLPIYMHPLHFVRLDRLPMNINGKIDRKALPPPSFNEVENDQEPCIGEIEIRLENIWKEILKRESIGRNESFFSIGGSSIKAIQIIARIQREFNVLIKLTDFFSNPMIKDVGSIILNAEQTAEVRLTN